MAKKLKAKEPIRLREKLLSNGNRSLYLDIYRNGKREYEFLKLYLIKETAGDTTAKERNKQTLLQAEIIKSKRIIELTNREAGIKNKEVCKMLLSEWLDEYYKSQQSKERKSLYNITSLKKRLEVFSGDKTTLEDVSKEYCKAFINHLSTYKSDRLKDGKLKYNTIKHYLRIFKCALNEAVRCDIIKENPFNKIASTDMPKAEESQRVFLSIEEVKKLMAIHVKGEYENTKGAFLFSCFCGLRISDVKKLKWKDVAVQNGKIVLSIVMQKTKAPINVPLSETALSFLPERADKKETDNVFELKSMATIEKHLKELARKADISKHLTFHVSRHTFATNLITKGADLPTISELLGHSNVQITQIYAKIVDQKKAEAVDLLNDI